jgi:hypothetical protein
MRIVPRVVRHNAVAFLALFVALGTGGAYAATHLARNSVGTAQLKNNAVVSSKVKNGSLRAVDFARGQLPAGLRGVPGPTGARGAQGIQGPAGPPGTAGQGFRFARGSGTTGPALTAAGTYFVDVEALLTAGATASIGDCGVIAGADIDLYHGAYTVPAGDSRSFSFPGMLTVQAGQAPLQTSIDCESVSGDPVSLSAIKWWVSPVG